MINKVRTLLTMLGIIIGVAAVIILVSVGNGLKAMINAQFTSLGTNLLIVMPGKVDLSSGDFRQLAGGFLNSKLTAEDAQALRAVANVENAVPFITAYLPIVNGGKSVVAEVLGSEPNYGAVLNWSPIAGRVFSRSEAEAGRRVAVIGTKIRDELFNTDPLGQSVQIGNARFQVIGVMAAKGGSGQMDWDKHAFIPLSSAKHLTGSQTVHDIYFQVMDRSRLNETLAAVRQAMLRRHKADDFSILQPSDLLKSVDSIIGAVTVALGGIAAISLIVGGIGIMNIMLVTVTERTREIGLRKAVGARSTDILWQFLIEAVVLSGCGGILGITLGYLGSLVLGRFLATSVTLWSVLLSFGVAGAVGIIFGLVPAYKASQLDPITALRYE